MHARIQIYWCRSSIFRHLKLELLTQFPASNDEKYINVVYIWRKFVSFYDYVHWRMTTEISVMYGSEKVKVYIFRVVYTYICQHAHITIYSFFKGQYKNIRLLATRHKGRHINSYSPPRLSDNYQYQRHFQKPISFGFGQLIFIKVDRRKNEKGARLISLTSKWPPYLSWRPHIMTEICANTRCSTFTWEMLVQRRWWWSNINPMMKQQAWPKYKYRVGSLHKV